MHKSNAAEAATAAVAAQQQRQQGNDSGVTTRLQHEVLMRPDPVTTSSSNQNTLSGLSVTTTSSIPVNSSPSLPSNPVQNWSIGQLRSQFQIETFKFGEFYHCVLA